MAEAAAAAAAARGGADAESKQIEELAATFTRSLLQRSTPIPIPPEEKREFERLSTELKGVMEAQRKWISDARGVGDLGPWRMSEEEKVAVAGHTTAVKNARQARADFAKRLPGQPGFLTHALATAQDHISATMNLPPASRKAANPTRRMRGRGGGGGDAPLDDAATATAGRSCAGYRRNRRMWRAPCGGAGGGERGGGASGGERGMELEKCGTPRQHVPRGALNLPGTTTAKRLTISCTSPMAQPASSVDTSSPLQTPWPLD